MRGYLAYLTDEFIEEKVKETCFPVLTCSLRLFEVKMINVNEGEVGDGLNRYDLDDVILMELIGKKDINEEELHEGAIIKADIEMYGIPHTGRTKGIVGVIEYSEELSHYHIYVDDSYVPLSALENIEKIGINCIYKTEMKKAGEDETT